MLVYGDRSHTVPVSVAVLHGASAIDRALDAWHADPLDAARCALIAVGVVEQALHDTADRGGPPGGLDASIVRAVDRSTDAVADVFAEQWARTQGALPTAARTQLGGVDADQRLGAARDALERIGRRAGRGGDPDVRVTTPEGFASYALLPDQYAAAASTWAEQVATSASPVAIAVGVRSIGTTLSAVVASLLRARGIEVARATVRPAGHPYERTLDALPDAITGAVDGAWCLVVDEGPGRSGSSMAAVVEALRRAGAAPERIVLLPAHAGGPGLEASERVRAIWRTTAQLVVAPSDLRWSGLDLDGVLADRSRAVLAGGGGGASVDVEDLGGGGWRHLAFDHPDDWPAVATAFERPSRRCVAGDGEAILWRYAGLDAAAVVERWRSPGVRPWRPECVGTVWGFVGTRWIAGRACTPADLDARVLDALAGHLDGSSGAPLHRSELAAGVDRLAAALVHGTALALGDTSATALGPLVARAATLAASLGDTGQPPARAGDGRTEPHGWVRDATDRLWKVDGFGPEHDHTLTGVQPLAWDVAGVVLSWELDDRWREALVARLAPAHPDLLVPGWLRFHELARAVLDLGRWTMSGHGADPADADRAARAVARTTAALARLVAVAAAEAETEPAGPADLPIPSERSVGRSDRRLEDGIGSAPP